MNINDFIKKYSVAATNAAAGTKVFPQTILTAAALESGYGESVLSAKYNNFFGIKADSSWKGKSVVMSTKEQDSSGNEYTVNAKFRSYDTAQESFSNYVKFISGPRYVKAGVLNAKTPTEQFEKIKAAGYATDKNYVAKLTKIYNSVTQWVSSNPGQVTAVLLVTAFFF